MDDVRRILCPVDRSDPARLALEFAALYAEQSGAAVTVLEVVEVPGAVGVGTGVAGQGIVDALEGSVGPALERFVQPLRDQGITVEVRIATGAVATQILRAADELPADLLVVGTHGRTGVERWLLGSVTERLLAHTHCPALVVPPRVAPSLPAKVLCATDFSESARTAFQQAVRVARASDAGLLLVHVVEWPFGAVSDGDDAVSRLFRSIADQARSALDGLAAEATAAGVSAETVVEPGRPRDVVTALAESRGANLIVVGATGVNAVQSVLIGSTTARVVRTASCPVLVTPSSPSSSARQRD